MTTRTERWIEEYGDLAGVVPYGDTVVAAYRIVRTRRIRTFLRGLAIATGRFSDSERALFDEYMNSPIGRELLADFAESTLRSRTRTATAAMAILYADYRNEMFGVNLKGDILPALEQLTDRTIDSLLLLVSHREHLPKTPDEGPYEVFALHGSTVSENPDLSAWSKDGRTWVAAVTDLIARRLLDPDWAAGSRLGGEDWAVYFSVSEFTVAAAKLLNLARNCLNAEEGSA